LGDRWKAEWYRERLRGLVGAKVGMVVGELLDVILNETVDVPLEHWTSYVESQFFSDILVDLLGVGRAAHAFDTEEFEVALLKVMETMTGEHVVDSDDGGRHGR
jgi:hypothetical protein